MALRLNCNMSEAEVALTKEKNLAENTANGVEASKKAVQAFLDAEAKDKKIMDAEEKARLKEENASLKRQNDLRETYMGTPITEGERVELQGLEQMANSGRNPDRSNMLRLSELRSKAKIKSEAKK